MAGNDGSTGADGGDQNSPASGGDQGTGADQSSQGASATTDSSGRVMTVGDAGYVNPGNGQVWNGTAWYNDKAVQVDPSTPIGAPVSYYVPDSYQWNGTSYVGGLDGGGPGSVSGDGGGSGSVSGDGTGTPYGGSTNQDSSGRVMTVGDAGYVDPGNGQVWNGTAWYNDKAVQVDPSTPIGAPVSYYVPDSYQWNADTGSYSAEGSGQGGGGNQQGNQQQQQGNQQQQQQQGSQQQGNPGGRQYAAPGQQNADGNWVPQVSNAAGQFGGAVANAVSPQQQQQQQAPQQSWQAPQQQQQQQQQQSYQAPQPQQSTQAPQSAGGGTPPRAPQTGTQPGPQQQQQTAAGAQPTGSGTQKPGPKTTGTQGAPPKSAPAKSKTGLIVAAVIVTGLAVGLGIWASWPKTPVDPKLSKKAATPAHAHESPAHGGA